MLTSIAIYHYKNYTHYEVDFVGKFTLITGLNGSGKTNLIDAAHYLCICKSYFTRLDKNNVLFESYGFRLDGVFDDTFEKTEISIRYETGGKKEVRNNKVPYTRLSNHVGKFPVVMIAPDDIQLINGHADERRRFLDSTISQIDSVYLSELITYNKLLLQRNALLKNLAQTKFIDNTFLQALNFQMAKCGDYIYNKRRIITEKLILLINYYYGKIAQDSEIAEIQYVSQLHSQSMISGLEKSFAQDCEAQRTCSGIHKDDLLFLLNQFNIRENGSQGQIKSYLIALKLAQFDLLRNATGKNPLLLLDDIFEKLDKRRLNALFNILQNNNFEQIMVTDADEQRSTELFKQNNISVQHITIENNTIPDRLNTVT